MNLQHIFSTDAECEKRFFSYVYDELGLKIGSIGTDGKLNDDRVFFFGDKDRYYITTPEILETVGRIIDAPLDNGVHRYESFSTVSAEQFAFGVLGMFCVQYTKKGSERELYLLETAGADKKMKKELAKIFDKLKKWTKKNRVKAKKSGSLAL